MTLPSTHRARRMAGLAIAAIAALTAHAAAADAAPNANGRIIFESKLNDPQGELYAMGPDGSDVVRLTTSVGSDRSPSASPDGKRIAFVSERTGFSEIFTMSANGTGTVQVTDDQALVTSPSLSPSGRVAFSSNRDGNPEIYTAKADGTGVVRLTNDPGFDVEPEFSPDGSRIAFVSNRDDFSGEVYVMDADGTDPHRLTNDIAQDGAPAWSPDGSSIAFRSDRGGDTDVYRMSSANGSGVTPVSKDALENATPVYSPDGGSIAYVTDMLGPVRVQVRAADGTGTPKTIGPGDVHFWGSLGWQPLPQKAAPPPQPPVTPPALDFDLNGRSKQGLRRVRVTARCSSACTATLRGSAVAGGRRAHTKPIVADLEADTTKRIRLRLPARAIRRLEGRGAKLKVRAEAVAGDERVSAARRIKLRG